MRLGPYTLDQELGRGASGVVYRGRSPQGQLVAIKLLSAQSPEVLDRFQREARLHEQLGEEAGFVPFHDMGLAEGRPYLVMPLLQGGTLRDRLQRGPLSVRGALELGERLATALGRAHALGIVHRDVKPENVLFDEGGHAFLADLGMAKHFRHDVTGASQSVVLSRAGEVRGTVSYMSPEQLKDATGAGPPADVFALGGVLYECLSGEPAFNAETYVELLVQIAGALHVPLRKRGQFPAWLTTLVEDTLVADPTKRPSDGLALAARLREGPARSAAQGKRTRLAASAIFGLSLIGSGIAGAVLLEQQRRGPPSESPASSSPAPSPSPSAPADEDPFPESWRTLRRGELLNLVAAWRPAGVSRASQVAITPKEGVLVVGEENVFALGEGPPRPLLVAKLPALRRSTSFAAEGSLFLVQEEAKVRSFNFREGALRYESETLPEGRLATYAFGGASTLVAHGRRLATYKAMGGPEGKANPNFAQLPEVPRVLAANLREAMASQGTKVAFLSASGEIRLVRDYASPVVALAYRFGLASDAQAQALIGTRSGALHGYEAGAHAPAVVETGLAPLQALCAGRRFAALAGEKGVALVDLETRAVIDRLDMSALETEVAGLALSQDEDALIVGTEDGQVLRYALRHPGQQPVPTVAPSRVWGDLRGRHASAVKTTVAGRHLASSDTTGAIHVWDPATGETLRSLQASSRNPSFVLGASGRAWVVDLGRVREWDVTTGHELRRFPSPSGTARIALREDERELAVLGQRGGVQVWDLESSSLRLERKFPLERRQPRQIALLKDGRLLLGYQDGGITLRSPGGAEVWTRRAGQADVHSFHALGEEQVLVACADGQISTWGLRGGRRGLDFKTDPLSSLSLRGDLLMLGFSSGRIELRRASTGEVLWNRAGGVGIQPQVALHSESEIFLGGADRQVRLVRFSAAAPLSEPWGPPPSGDVYLGLGFSSESRLITLAQERARTFDTATGEELAPRPLGRMRGATFGRGHFLTTGASLGDLRRATSGLYAWGTGSDAQPSLLSSPAPSRHALSADGRVAVYSAKPGRKSGIQIVNLETKAQSFLPISGRVITLQLSAHGRYLILSSGIDLECWSLLEQKKLSSWRSPASLLEFLPSTPPLLCEAQLYGKVRILDPLTGKVLHSFTPRSRLRPTLIAGDPSGKRIALPFGDGSLELWAVPAGKRLARLELPNPSDPVRALAFSPGGEQLAALTGRGQLLLFSLPE